MNNKKCAENCIIIRRTDRNIKRCLWAIQARKQFVKENDITLKRGWAAPYGALVRRLDCKGDWVYVQEAGDGCVYHINGKHKVISIKAIKLG